MRLIDIRTNSLKEFTPRQKPSYAILSHRWTKDEVTFTDICSANFRPTSSLAKFWGFLQQAKQDNLHLAWVDTCCIDKQSSAELSEAINSMYRWYQDAKCCYVYLQDVQKATWRESFHKSKWFRRGWTLQELLAPSKIVFYDQDWQQLGTKLSLAPEISLITGIAVDAIQTGDLSLYSIAQKMSWAAKRTTTRPEDAAYCLMGLFEVNMPLLYGEGERAFLRLQQEIIKDSDDHSIFAWSMGKRKFSGLLAPMPSCFSGAGKMNSLPSELAPVPVSGLNLEPYSMTNRGLSINLSITPWSADTYLAFLNCVMDDQGRNIGLGIFLRRLDTDDQYVRVNVRRRGLWLSTSSSFYISRTAIQTRQLFVRQFSKQLQQIPFDNLIYGFKISDGWLPPSATVQAVYTFPNELIAILPPGNWCCVMMIEFIALRTGLRRIALGFDFDCHPVCLLEDSNSCNSFVEPAFEGWSRTLQQDHQWIPAYNGDRYNREKRHDGRWALKGHRLLGISIQLSDPFRESRSSSVTLKRSSVGSRWIWSLHIDELDGPFQRRNNLYTRRNFAFRESQDGQVACSSKWTDLHLVLHK